MRDWGNDHDASGGDCERCAARCEFNGRRGARIVLVQEAWYRLRRMGFTELMALFR